jgi:hypothetical protein
MEMKGSEMIGKTRKHYFAGMVTLAMLLLAAYIPATSGLEFPGPIPGEAQGSVSGRELIVENRLMSCAWDVSEGRLRPKHVKNKLTGAALPLREAECFQFVLDRGRIVKASDLEIVGGAELNDLQPNGKSCRPAERFGGKRISLTLFSSDKDLNVEWRVFLRDGSNYIRQQIILATANQAIGLKEIVLVELPASHAEAMGTVDGSPVVAANIFFAYEDPLARSHISQEAPRHFRCSLPCNTTLKPGEQLVQSSVIGVVPEGQLRRAFSYYIERERAQPYRPFLHYNSWYDIGYGPEKIQEREFLTVIESFGEELVTRRKVVMDSFVLDDGWDDTASLWQFHSGFPVGLSRLRDAADKYDAALGAWLSPWGGYGQAKQQRMKYGQQQGFETNRGGFSLAGPKYYARFRDVCVNMLRAYELNYFKFDGIAAGGRPTGVGSEFVKDVQALLRLVSELREVKPDVFVNITTGTWPSPYWLWYGDSTWRAGADWSTFGWGSKRQQQITFRDKETYHNVVCRAPLYPLNSLMTQGIMFASHGLPDEIDGLVDDIWAFFASGTNCQELYITPSLMSSQAWDALAEAAKWSRNNADVLVDTHWVGGDPAKGQIYGWASWSRHKGILSLRNPHDRPHEITLDIGKVFELPNGAAQKYSLSSPRKKKGATAEIVLSAGKEHTFELKPFEVLVFDAAPL